VGEEERQSVASNSEKKLRQENGKKERHRTAAGGKLMAVVG